MIYYTERLVLRPYQKSDYTAWKKGIDERLEKQNDFDTGKIENVDEEYFDDFLGFLQEMERKDKMYVFAAFDRVSGRHVGVLEMTILLRNGFDWGLFGVSIHNNLWGKGYGKELTKASIEVAKLLGIFRLECDIEEGNVRSEKMVTDFGFEFESKRKNFYFDGEKYLDMNVFVKDLRE